jgi:hypothetical protein
MVKLAFNKDKYQERIDGCFTDIVNDLQKNSIEGKTMLDVVIDRDLYPPISNRIRKEIPDVRFVMKHKSGISVILKNNKVGFTLKFEIN